MDYKILGKQNLTPVALKTMTEEERKQLCSELRDKILNTVASNGGHLASNLGVIELTVALLSVFDYTRDKIVFDVGHQSYAYKILTGRFDEFDTLRKKAASPDSQGSANQSMTVSIRDTVRLRSRRPSEWRAHGISGRTTVTSFPW